MGGLPLIGGGKSDLSNSLLGRSLFFLFCCLFSNNLFAQSDWRLVQDFESLTSSDVKACKNDNDGAVSSSSIATASIINNVEGYGNVGNFQMLQGYQGHHGIVFSVDLGTNILSGYTNIRFDIRYLSGDCMQKDVYVAVRNGSSGGFAQLASKYNGNEFDTNWQSFTFNNISSSGKDYSDFEIFISLGTQSNPLSFQIDNIQLYGPAIGSSAIEIDETKNNTITVQTDATVNLTRSLVANVWNTICLPFVPTEDQAKTIFGVGAKFAEFSSVSNNVMQFTSVDVGSLEAGKPYLVLPTKNLSTENPVALTGVNITATSPSTVEHDGYEFIGTYEKKSFANTEWETTRFVGTGNNLLKPNSTGALRSLRAYFTVPVPGGSGAKKYTFAVDSFVPTSIDNIQIEGDGDGAIYNIGGQRVEGKSLPKGIYIREGKKFVVK